MAILQLVFLDRECAQRMHIRNNSSSHTKVSVLRQTIAPFSDSLHIGRGACLREVSVLSQTGEIRFTVTSPSSRITSPQSTRERRLTSLQGHQKICSNQLEESACRSADLSRREPYAISAEPRSVPNFVSGGMTRHIVKGEYWATWAAA